MCGACSVPSSPSVERDASGSACRKCDGRKKVAAYVAASLNNVGGVLERQGDLAGAREHYERALAMCIALHGDAPLEDIARVCGDAGANLLPIDLAA